jgi:hypothetical protein
VSAARHLRSHRLLRSSLFDHFQLHKAKKIVKARSRDRCEARLPEVCTLWRQQFHYIVPGSTNPTTSSPCAIPVGNFLADNPIWARHHGLLKPNPQ